MLFRDIVLFCSGNLKTGKWRHLNHIFTPQAAVPAKATYPGLLENAGQKMTYESAVHFQDCSTEVFLYSKLYIKLPTVLQRKPLSLRLTISLESPENFSTWETAPENTCFQDIAFVLWEKLFFTLHYNGLWRCPQYLWKF